MADKAELIIESKEKVAYDLAKKIEANTQKIHPDNYRKEYLDLYAECLHTVDGRRELVKTK